MKNYIVKSARIFFTITALLSFCSIDAQTLMPIPGQATTYCCNTRGFWFQAPVSFRIVGVRVPTDASTSSQSVAVVRFNGGAPPFYSSTTNNFSTLALYQGVSGSNVLPVNIVVNQGDYIGLLGSRGGTNSYGTGNYSTNILGQPVTLYRMGMQYNLETTNPQNLWQENANISRVEMYYKVLKIDEFPYCQDFEADDGDWSTSGVFPTWEYGEPNNTLINAANSGNNAWVTGLDSTYHNSELSQLVSPEFDLTALVDPMVRFWTIRNLQTGVDGVNFQVSSDSGYTYSVLGSSSSTPPWYNSSSITALSAQGNGNGWTGTNSAWVSMQHSLLGYAADTSIFFRFRMAANSSTVAEGFGFDDFIIGESNDLAITALLYPDSICGNSNTTIRAVICNKSITEKYGFSVTLDTNSGNVTANYPDTLAICSCDTLDLLTMNTTDGGTWNLFATLDDNGDVNSANDTMSGVMTIFGTPYASVSGGGSYCQGDIAQLSFTFTGTAPFNLTYTNGSNNIFNGNLTSNPFTATITTSGIYSIVELSDASGCPADTSSLTGEAIVIFHPAPNINLGPDDEVCGDQILDPGAGYSTYSWSTGASTQTITANSTGTYGVTVTDTNGCDGTDEITLTIHPLPIVNLPDTVICEGGTFIFNAGGGYASYVWSDGSSGQQLQVNSTGTWTVTVTDFNGCEGTDAGSITAIVTNPTPTVQSVPGLAPVTLNAGSGYASYLWNTNATTQIIQVSVAGTYTCTVTDYNGCKGSGQAKTKIWPTGIQDVVSESGFGIFPNPTSGNLILEFSPEFSKPDEVQIFNMLGQFVQQISIESSQAHSVISLSESLTSGKYILRFKSDDGLKEAEFMLVK